jgi:hypothetical protein
MQVGSIVTFEGREYRVRGFSPMGAGKRHVFLEDVETREWRTVDWEHATPDGTETRLVEPDTDADA